MVLRSIVEGNAGQFDATERAAAVCWLEARVRLEPTDKNSSPSRNSSIEIAAGAASLAIANYEQGDLAAAKQDAQDALNSLEG